MVTHYECVPIVIVTGFVLLTRVIPIELEQENNEIYNKIKFNSSQMDYINCARTVYRYDWVMTQVWLSQMGSNGESQVRFVNPTRYRFDAWNLTDFTWNKEF